jgi:spore germination protein GerM
LFRLALVLLVLVIFLFNQKNIETVLRKTGFMNLFDGKDDPIEITIDSPSDQIDQDNTDEAPPDENVIIEIESDIPEEQPGGVDESEKQEDETPVERIRKARLYFVSVQADGGIALKSVIREVSFRDSPLRETLTALMSGPTSTELNQGLLNIIPERARLKNVYVKKNTAYIDFSEEFRFNSIGQAGLEAQLKQVVFTATEFSNVRSVQILIEGKIQRFLSPEGLLIQKPISRDSLTG